jgi:hypothetical protein
LTGPDGFGFCGADARRDTHRDIASVAFREPVLVIRGGRQQASALSGRVATIP